MGLRRLTGEQITGWTAPSRLALLHGRGITAVADPQEGRVHLLDPRYRQSLATTCLPTAPFTAVDPRPDLQGDCPEGEVALHRGWVEGRGAPIDVAADEEDVSFRILTAASEVLRVEADVVEAHPWDWLRVTDVIDTGLPMPLGEGALAMMDGRVFVAVGPRLLTFEPDGTLVGDETLPGTVRRLSTDGGLWARMDDAVWSPATGVVEAPGVMGLTGDGAGGVWLVASGVVRHLDGAGSVLGESTVDGLLGPVDRDPASGAVWALTAVGLARVDGGLVAFEDVGPALDVGVNAAHEVVLLREGGAVEVYADETALGEGVPLDVMLVTFAERPQSEPNDVGCAGDEGIAGILSLLARNRRLLDDLPVTPTIGVTPYLVQRTESCGRLAELGVALAGRTDLGVLHHEEIGDACADDPTCYADWLALREDRVRQLGDPTWLAGLNAHASRGLDWVQVAVDAGWSRTPFFSMNVLPDVDQEGDPRSKEVWPLVLPELPRAWTQGSAFDPAVPGGMAFYPGVSVAAFSLGACPGLLLAECRVTGGGAGAVLDDEAIELVDLALHRALAARREGQVNTWSFHLPDIGTYAYTEGCLETDGRWSDDGDAICQAARLQGFIEGVHGRLVLNGLARWASPRELDRPPDP